MNLRTLKAVAVVTSLYGDFNSLSISRGFEIFTEPIFNMESVCKGVIELVSPDISADRAEHLKKH